MRKSRSRVISTLLILALAAGAFSYGFVSGKFGIFPHHHLKSIHDKVSTKLTEIQKGEDERPALFVFSLEEEDSVFPGHGGWGAGDHAFDVVSADMDLDGDPDLFVNRHHTDPWEFYENTASGFRRINSPGEDRSGLWENAEIPDLYVDEKTISKAIEESGSPGLYVWHDLDRMGFYHFRFEEVPAETSLHVRVNSAIIAVDGLAATDRHAIGSYDIEIPRVGPDDRSFRLRKRNVGGQVVVRLSTPNGAPLPVFVGRDLTPISSESVEIWMRDPHGIAWVQVQDSPEPDIFVTTGGMTGDLAPPHDPQADLFYVFTGSEEQKYRAAAKGVIPANHGRGRKVEWVDVDNDGINELYVGNTDTSNSLLVLDPSTGRYRDEAFAYDLAFKCGAILTRPRV